MTTFARTHRQAIAAIAVGLGLCTHALAEPRMLANLTASYQVSPDEPVEERRFRDAAMPVSNALSVGNGATTASVVADAVPKGLFVELDVSNADPSSFSLAHAYTTTFNLLTGHVAGHEGETALVTAAIGVSTSFSGAAADDSDYIVSASTEFDVDEGRGFSKYQSIQLSDNPAWHLGGAITSFTATFPITLGKPTSYWMFLETALEGTRNEGAVDASFDISVSWLGITGITDTDGNAYASYSFTDESGADWITAVPEPAAFGCLILAPVLATLRGRHRPRRQAFTSSPAPATSRLGRSSV